MDAEFKKLRKANREGLIPVRVEVKPEDGDPYFAIRHKNPETMGFEIVGEKLTEDVKKVDDIVGFVRDNSIRFDSLAPTQKQHFIEILQDATKLLGRVGKQMEEDFKTAKAKEGLPAYTHDNPRNPIARARGHIKEAILAAQKGNTTRLRHNTGLFISDYGEALNKYQTQTRQYIQKMIDTLLKDTGDTGRGEEEKELKEEILGRIHRFIRQMEGLDNGNKVGTTGSYGRTTEKTTESYGNKEIYTAKSTGSYGMTQPSHQSPEAIQDAIRALVVKGYNTTETEDRLLDSNPSKIDSFLKGYERLALLGKEYGDNRIEELYDMASGINIANSFELSLTGADRIEKIISIDSIAHSLHKQKDENGKSQYAILDELADISKSYGELDRSIRLAILENPLVASDLNCLLGIEILQKGGLETASKFWKLFERAIKEGVEKLDNEALVVLREWLYAKI